MSEPTITKKCSKCKKIKSVSEFYRNKSEKDGFHHHCKSCVIIHSKSAEGKAIAKRYHQSKKGKISRAKAQKRWRAKHPEYKKHYYADKVRARGAVGRAVRNKKLVIIGSLMCACDKPAQDYHHYKGYAPEYQLDVQAVCRICHKRFHL